VSPNATSTTAWQSHGAWADGRKTLSCFGPERRWQRDGGVHIKIDASLRPAVTARLSRAGLQWLVQPPRHDPLGGTDATSGVAYCGSATYQVRTGSRTVNGGCVDRAGNSGGSQVHLAYDATRQCCARSPTSTAGADV